MITAIAPREEFSVTHLVAATSTPLANAAFLCGSRHASRTKLRSWQDGRAARLIAAGLCVLACASTAQADDVARAMPADAFIGTLAVITHVNYTDGAYVNVHNVADDLAWLGITHVRDLSPNGSPPFASYVYLAQHGVKFNFLMRTKSTTSRLPGTT
jgi:hypothetical protein